MQLLIHCYPQAGTNASGAEMSQFVETVIIGAGPAGLTAAYHLAKNQRGTIVLEQDPVYVGGISRTVNYKGYLFDIGGHRFFSKSKEIVELWNEILPDDFIERPRLSRIYYRDKFYSYPLKAFEALRNLGIFESTACIMSYGLARAFPVKMPLFEKNADFDRKLSSISNQRMRVTAFLLRIS